METTDFFRCRIDAMIDLKHPLAVLATRLPWGAIEAYLAPKFERRDRPGELIEGQDLLGPTSALVGAGRSRAGRPRIPIRLMASLLYLKHSFNLSDEDVCEYPDKLLIDGVVKLKERYAQIFSDGALHARIANRMAMGQRVIDHEFVTRTFPDGLGVKQWIAIYDVKDRKIVRVTLMPGPVDMGAKQ